MRAPARFLQKLAIMSGAFFIIYAIFTIAIEAFCNIPPPEATLSFWGRAADVQFLMADKPVFREHRQWLWEPNPGAEFYHSIIQSDAYRGAPVSKEKTDAFRILTLGDSSTMGFGVEEDQCWPRQLETMLRAAGKRVEVINFGCVGYTAFQGLQLYLGKCKDYSPDLVVLAFGAVNECIPSDDQRSQPEKIKIISSAQFQIRRTARKFIIFRFLESLFRGTRTPERESAESRPAGGIIYNLSAKEFESSLTRIIQLQKDRGAHSLLVSPPRRRNAELQYSHVIQYTETIHAVAKSTGAPLVDIYSLFRAREPEYTNLTKPVPPDDWYLDSVHPTPDGHRNYAAQIAKTLLESGIVK